MLEITIDINAKDFRDFAFFDVFVRLRRWIMFCVFAGIMTVSAVLCFVLPSQESGVFPGIMLLLIGLGLPLVYVRQFSVSVNAQIKKMDLGGGRHVYTLDLSPEGVLARMAGSETEETYPWEEVYGIWRGKTAVYLYVKSTKAFLIPDRLVPNTSALWEQLSSKLPADKLHGQR